LELLTKYPWQQFVVEAFGEFQPEVLQRKIGIAKHAVAQRLREAPTDPEEQVALENARIALYVLMRRNEEE
jgi:hypothetical protein